MNGDNQLSWYEAVYSKVLESVQNGDNLRGALFWRWAEDGGTDSTTVYTGDATFQYAPLPSLDAFDCAFGFSEGGLRRSLNRLVEVS